MQLLYFAWVRERIGISEEQAAKPANVATAADLVSWLCSRGAGYEAALADRSRLRVAINQQHADWNAPVHDHDEIALFPPVTGG